MSVRIVLRQKKGQAEGAVMEQSESTGNMIVSVREGLLSEEAFGVMRQVLRALERDYHVDLPEPVRRRTVTKILHDEAERVARMTPDERAEHVAREQIIREMIDRLDALAV